MTALKAYSVTEGGEGHGCVVFATNSAAARREGASELDTDWGGIESCRRAPYLDEHAPGPVPKLAMLDAGWWFECSCIDCGRRISLTDEDEEDDEGNPLPPLQPVELAASIFCTPTCCATQCAWWRGRKAAEAALCELIYTRWPEAKIVHVHVYGDRLERSEPRHGIRCSAAFKLPGLQWPVDYHFGEPDYFVAREDVDAFKALYGPESAA